MRIKSIEIVGFQSHVDTKLTFSSGLTVITGESDCGKTAILRALRWVCLGEPTGDAFVHLQVGQASVSILLENDYKITKHRKGTQTIYTIETPDGEGMQEYVMAKVPDEVTALTGIRQDNFGEFEANLNFAFQLEPPFLISETPSTGAKVLGALANVDDVDGALKDAVSEVYKLRDTKTSAQKRIEELTEELKQYDNIEQLEAELTAIEYLLNNIEQMQNRLALLNNLQDKLQQSQAKIDVLEQRLLDLAVVPELAEDLKNIEASQARYEKLLNVFSNLHKYQLTISNLQSRLDHYKCLETYQQTITEIQSQHDRITMLVKLDKQYTATVSSKQLLERRLQGFTGVGNLKSTLAHVDKSYQRLVLLSNLDKQHTTVVGNLLRTEYNVAHAQDGLVKLNSEYEEVWASVTCCPLDGESYCKLKGV